MTQKTSTSRDTPPSAYQRAVNALKIISDSGFTDDSLLDDGNHGFHMEVDEEDRPMARLIVSAAQMAAKATPPIPMQASFIESESELQLLFDASLKKPPIRALRSYLDKTKELFMNHCVLKRQDGYYISNPRNLSIDPIDLAISFVEPGERHTCYYRMPTGQVFIDSKGERHTDTRLVTARVMTEYLAAHYPDITLDRLNPAAAVIAPETMQRLIDGLGIAPKAALRS